MKTICKTALALGFASVLLGQDEKDALKERIRTNVRQVVGAEVKSTFEFVSGQLLSGPPVKGAPYSAEAVNETIQVLADGNRIVQRTSAMQYRDTEGRERREETSAMGAIFITDPIAGARYTLHPDTKSADKNDPAAIFNLKVNGGDVFFFSNANTGGGRGTGPGPEQGLGISGVATGRFTAARKVTELNDAKTEQLGTMYIEGVQAQGTRTTRTIPAGDIGNERPITIVDERWYSPELQITVMTKHSDPMAGETSFQLKNISRSSPAAYLFEIPADYTVRTGPQTKQLRPE